MTLKEAIEKCMLDGPFGDSLLIIRLCEKNSMSCRYILSNYEGKRGWIFSAHWSATWKSIGNLLKDLKWANEEGTRFADDVQRLTDWQVMTLQELADWNHKQFIGS